MPAFPLMNIGRFACGKDLSVHHIVQRKRLAIAAGKNVATGGTARTYPMLIQQFLKGSNYRDWRRPAPNFTISTT
jgi:hypothetical protein